MQPMRLERVGVAVRRPLDLDAVGAHQAPAGEAPAVGEMEGRAAYHDLVDYLGRGQAGAAGESEGGAEGYGLGRPSTRPIRVLAGIGHEAAHAHALFGEAVPDR